MARKQASASTKGDFTMSFQAAELSIQLIEAIAPLMPRIKATRQVAR
jgi:hypothetical protein